MDLYKTYLGLMLCQKTFAKVAHLPNIKLVISAFLSFLNF